MDSEKILARVYLRKKLFRFILRRLKHIRLIMVIFFIFIVHVPRKPSKNAEEKLLIAKFISKWVDKRFPLLTLFQSKNRRKKNLIFFVFISLTRLKVLHWWFEYSTPGSYVCSKEIFNNEFIWSNNVRNFHFNWILKSFSIVTQNE